MTAPSVLIDCNDHNAENPLWHPQHRCLYWTDIPEGRLFRYDPTQKTYEKIYSGEPVGGFTIQADGSLLLFKTEGTVEIWQAGQTISVIPHIPAARGTRFNDAIADRTGRVYSGIMATDDNPGKLYRIDTDGSYHAVVDDLLVPNGMAFDADYQHFFLTDSDNHVIYRFDYDETTGSLSHQTEFINTPKDDGVPDGMTIDAEGYIWSARWNGSSVHRYTPDGKHHSRVELPTPKVSCVTFGGDSYDRIFISSARGDDYSEFSQPNSTAGDIFEMTSDVKGRAECFSRIQISAHRIAH